MSNIQLLKTRMKITDDLEFIRRITEEFVRSQRQYYRDNPPQTGIPVSWIEVPRDWSYK